jgi:hypothetical protein
VFLPKGILLSRVCGEQPAQPNVDLTRVLGPQCVLYGLQEAGLDAGRREVVGELQGRMCSRGTDQSSVDEQYAGSGEWVSVPSRRRT